MNRPSTAHLETAPPDEPVYIFGGFGTVAIFLGLAAALLAIVLKMFADTSLIQTPLPLVAVMCVMIGAMSVLMGLLAEIVVRVYFEAQTKDVYRVRERLNFD